MITKINPTPNDVTLRIHKDYHGLGYDLCKKSEITIHPGLTVLVGCNGSGKSTLIAQIRDKVHKRKDTLYTEYNDFTDGRSIATSAAGLFGNIETMASLLMSSEGEALHFNIGNKIKNLGTKIKKTNPKYVWFTMDAADSGLSIDYIDDIKDFCNFVQEINPEIIFYIIIAANEYEMARESTCLDVTKMEYHTFPTYDDYRDFILKSRKTRDSLSKKKNKTDNKSRSSNKSKPKMSPEQKANMVIKQAVETNEGSDIQNIINEYSGEETIETIEINGKEFPFSYTTYNHKGTSVKL